MELHPEQRFEIARQRQAEKLARGLEAYATLRAASAVRERSSGRRLRPLELYRTAVVRTRALLVLVAVFLAASTVMTVALGWSDGSAPRPVERTAPAALPEDVLPGGASAPGAMFAD